MFDNIGYKIKILAKVVCWMGIIMSLIIAVMFFCDHVVVSGICWLIVGPLLSWVGSFVLYGFGQLVDNSDIIVNKIDSLKNIGRNSDVIADNTANISSAITFYAMNRDDSKIPSDVNPENDDNTARKPISKNKDNMIICPKCGRQNQAIRVVCWACGELLQKDDK